MDVDALTLRVFVTVARERHFGRAAHRLNLSVSAVSKHIRRLEVTLGARLIDRSASGVAGLTAAGEAVLVEAATVVAAVDRLACAPARARPRDVVIALPGRFGDQVPAAAWVVLAGLVAREAPGVRIRVRGIPFGRFATAVSDADADIAIDTARRLPAGLTRSPIGAVQRSLAVSASAADLDELAQEPLQARLRLVDGPDQCRAWTNTWRLADTLDHVDTVALPGARSLADVLAPVAAGLGQAVTLPIARDSVLEGVRLVPLPVAATPVYAVSRRNPTRAERVVLDLLGILAGSALRPPAAHADASATGDLS